ncbi:MAG TPA: hypothetical protein EYQ84_06515 [Nitrospinaceae bacterium]|jgi:hypothetical protein|nr:hypothetical protein [Nitrospinaceae bacterium]HIL27283.1 hypothetical protein [Nitrospinaceae bacterium]
MRKLIGFLVVVGFLALVGSVSADDVVPGAYGQPDYSVMSVGKTQMQIGSSARAHANYVNTKSGAGRAASNAGNGGGADFQWGESQQENSWKAAKTVEEAQVFGLVPGDCQGDNSDGNYRKQMNQNRKGYMSEPLVSNAQCEVDHATLK